MSEEPTLQSGIAVPQSEGGHDRGPTPTTKTLCKAAAAEVAMPFENRHAPQSRVFHSLKADTTKEPLATGDEIRQHVQSDSSQSAPNKGKIADTTSGPVHRPRVASIGITNA